MRARPGFVFFLTLLAASAAPVCGCPVCDTGTGQQVRAGLAGDDLGISVLATLLPFAVVLGITAIIHFGLPGIGRKDDDRS